MEHHQISVMLSGPRHYKKGILALVEWTTLEIMERSYIPNGQRFRERTQVSRDIFT